MFTGGLVLAVALLVLLVVALFKAVRMVPQGYAWTVEAFGKYTHTMQPGLHFLVPIYQDVGRKINMMEQVLEVPSQDVITRDNAVVKVDGVVFFQVLDAAKAAYEVAQLEVAVLNLVMTNIRTRWIPRLIRGALKSTASNSRISSRRATWSSPWPVR